MNVHDKEVKSTLSFTADKIDKAADRVLYAAEEVYSQSRHISRHREEILKALQMVLEQNATSCLNDAAKNQDSYLRGKAEAFHIAMQIVNSWRILLMMRGTFP
jgi:hypothetical protein